MQASFSESVADAVAFSFIGAGYERTVPALQRNPAMLNDTLDRSTMQRKTKAISLI
jgi:hypothetical protein